MSDDDYNDDDGSYRDELDWLEKPITRGDVLGFIIGVGVISGLFWLFDTVFK